MDVVTNLAETPIDRPEHPTANRRGLVAIGRGQPVVLLHATLSSKAQWTTLAQRLARRFQAIALDLHGYGDNRGLTGPRDFAIDDEIDLVLARLDSVLGCNVPVHLVGHSYGGLVALQFALRHPMLVRSLTLYEPLVLSLFAADDPIFAGMRTTGFAVTEYVARRSYFEAARCFYDFWSGDGAFAALSLPSKARFAASADQIAQNFHGAIRSPVTLDALRDLRVRTLLLSGSRGPFFTQRIVELLAAMLPDVKLKWIDADHMAPLNAPERVDPWIETFIEVQAARHQATR